MEYQTTLQNHLQIVVGKKLNALNLACEMMMFSFSDYELHAQCFVRIINNDDILVTTTDYQSWDGEICKNNDEWFFVEQFKPQITGGVVTSVTVQPYYDVTIKLDNGIMIELCVKNGYHHFDDEQEQWVFFKRNDNSHPFITVYNKTVDISTE